MTAQPFDSMSSSMPRSRRARLVRRPIADAGNIAPWPSWPAELVRFERLLADLSARFISLAPAHIDTAIDDALRGIVEALDIDRCTLSIFRPEEGWFRNVHSWTRSGLALAKLGALLQRFPWAVAELNQRQVIVFSSTDELPPEAAVDKASFDRAGVRSHVSIPFVVGEQVVGALSFAALRQPRTWPEELLGRFRLVAEIFGNALARKRAQEELEQLFAFEQMLAEIAASLVAPPTADVDAAIEAGLQRTARFLGVDRTALWALESDRTSLRRTHLWIAKEAPELPAFANVDMPWLAARIRGGDLIRMRHPDELPPDAHADRSALAALKTISLLVVPLRIGDAVVGALSLATIHALHEWPDSLVPRVRLLGEVFVAALARQHSEQRVYVAQAEAAQHRERLAHLVRVHTVGEMSAGIAHEINQPLVAIENYALAARRHVAGEGHVDKAKLTALLDKIVTQSSRAGDVIKHLRALVRRHEFEMTRLDVRRVVTDSMRFAEMEGQLRDISIEFRLPDEIPAVIADEVQIQQVVLNLSRNAIEAMARLSGATRKLLIIEAGIEDDQTVFVRVDDSGPGFLDGDADRIFEPFYSTKGSGLGIGLSLCRTIIEAHGGRLWAWPARDGGAVFKFTLPCADEPG
jgi:C4-dicarboxylate-specific signal transduction histidine kinase